MSKKTWVDPNGYEIPESRVTAQEKKEQKIVDECLKLAREASEKLEEARNTIFDMVNGHLGDCARYAKLDDWKGNGFLRNFRDTVRIKKEIKNNIQPDNNIFVCKQIVDECLNDWKKGAKKELQAVIQGYFRTDQKGNFKMDNLIALKKVKVEHPRWKEAMEYLDKSLTVVSSKAYYAVEVKDEEGEWHRIPLNFHEIKPESVKEAEDTGQAEHESKDAA